MQALPCHIRADVLSDAGGHGFAGHRLGGSWHGDREEKREMRLKASVGGEHPSPDIYEGDSYFYEGRSCPDYGRR